MSSGPTARYTEQQLPADIELIEVPPGVVILRAQGPENVDPDEIERYYVLRDDPAVGGADIENPEPDRDSSSGGSGEPIVTFEFTDEGRPRWEAMTREITRRGLANTQPSEPPDQSNQHFAIVLDREILSVAPDRLAGEPRRPRRKRWHPDRRWL